MDICPLCSTSCACGANATVATLTAEVERLTKERDGLVLVNAALRNEADPANTAKVAIESIAEIMGERDAAIRERAGCAALVLDAEQRAEALAVALADCLNGRRVAASMKSEDWRDIANGREAPFVEELIQQSNPSETAPEAYVGNVFVLFKSGNPVEVRRTYEGAASEQSRWEISHTYDLNGKRVEYSIVEYEEKP